MNAPRRLADLMPDDVAPPGPRRHVRTQPTAGAYVARLARHMLVAGVVTLGWWCAVAPAEGAAATASDVALQVSLKQDASLRLRGGRFVGPSRADMAAIDAVIRRHPGVRIEPVFGEPGPSSDRNEESSCDSDALGRHYRIYAQNGGERDRLLAALRPLAVVDAVIPEPEPAPPPTTTPDFTSLQLYKGPAQGLDPDPAGIDTAAAAAAAGQVAGGGGLGQNVNIADVEYSWNLSHEDIDPRHPTLIQNGAPDDPNHDVDHGTAVLGVLGAADNGFGVTGIATGSPISVVNSHHSTPETWALAEAIELACEHLSPGDVMLVEQQYDLHDPPAKDFVPVEYWPAVHAAIEAATRKGIIVVEPAGNGGLDLGALPALQDSGAIVVGAGTQCNNGSTARRPDSTYGIRVDLQGWGGCVMTTGYGGTPPDGYDGGPNAKYTGTFNGTSSAAAVVAGAAALYSSVFEAVARKPPTSQAVRRRLVETGTPQAEPAAAHIGPLPDLRRALDGFDYEPPTVTIDAGPWTTPTNDSTPTFTFTMSEAVEKTECRFRGLTDTFSGCTSPFTAPALPNGPLVLEVRATDLALNTGPPATLGFSVDTGAPAVSITGGPSGVITDRTPTFTFVSYDGIRFDCHAGPPLGLGPFAPCSSPHTTAPLADGPNVFEVRATDAAGNVGPAVSRSFTVAAPTEGSSGGVNAIAPAPSPSPAMYPTIEAPLIANARVTKDGYVRLPKTKVVCPKKGGECRLKITATASFGRITAIGSKEATLRQGETVTNVKFRLKRRARTSLRRSGRFTARITIAATQATRTAKTKIRLTIVKFRR